jgi:hypothetical protein
MRLRKRKLLRLPTNSAALFIVSGTQHLSFIIQSGDPAQADSSELGAVMLCQTRETLHVEVQHEDLSHHRNCSQRRLSTIGCVLRRLYFGCID